MQVVRMKKKTVAMEALLLQPNSEFCEERKCVFVCRTV